MNIAAKILRPALLAALALAALLAAALAALAPAAAEPPPSDLTLTLSTDDADGVIEPGQQFTLLADLTWAGTRDPLSANQLQIGGGRVRHGSNQFDWDSGGSSLRLNAFSAPDQPRPTVVSYTPIDIRDADGEKPAPGERARTMIRALDGRTALVYRSPGPSGAPGRIYVYDIYNKRQSITITPPPGADTRDFATSPVGHLLRTRTWIGKPMAVWHETENLAWIFVGSFADAHHGSSGSSHVGSLYVWSLDWSTEPPTLELRATLFPSQQDACNHQHATGCWSQFGTAVAISADGRVLAVSAFRANRAGAAYVYMRPDGEGQSWGDVSHENAIKVTPYVTPAWGASDTAGQRPFDSGSTGRTGAATDCDAYCSNVFSWVGSEFGARAIQLSGDGEVLAVGAMDKHYSSLTPGGSFSGHTQVGQVAVFVAPGGDWEAAAKDARFDDDGNAKQLIGARESATAFDPDTHYAPGPRLRITEPTAKLSFGDWASPPTNSWFGSAVDVTLDGRTIAAGTGWDFQSVGDANNGGRRIVQIFQLEAGQTWADIGAANPTGLNTWTAQYHRTTGQENKQFPHGQIAFSADGAALLMGSPNGGQGADQGNVWLVRRPANGRWSGNINGPSSNDQGRGGGLTIWETPTFHGHNNAGFGYIAISPDRQLVALSSLGQKGLDLPGCCNDVATTGSRAYLSDAAEGCSTRPRERDGIVDLVTTCRIAIPGASAFVPQGAAHGAFRISAELTNVRLGDDTANAIARLSGELELEIGTVKEVAEAKLEFATNTRGTADTEDDTIWPAAIAAGQSTQLRLQILTDRGLPAATGSISSVVAGTTAGTLQSNIGAAPGCTGGAGPICRIDASALTGDNADNILLTLQYGAGPDAAPGTAQVDVRIISKAGDTLQSEVVTVTFTGPPAALAVAAPSVGLLNVDTPDDGADQDDRDLLTLAVTATDKAGATVAVPTTGTQRAWLTGPDDKRVTSGVEIEWPLGGAANPTLDADGNRQVRIDIDRPAAQPLANGEYTLSLTAGSLTATQTFTVSGGPAAVALSPERLEIAHETEFTVTASLTDAAGAAVPNGTPLEWSEIAAGANAGLIRRSADRTTTDGQASATWFAIRPGQFTLTASAAGVTAVAIITVPAPPAPSPAESLSATAPGAFAIWLGDAPIRASDLLPALEGVTTISSWYNSRWSHYGVVAGQLQPDSRDFPIRPGAVLWLENQTP